jgi:sugar lactone lactonase YvrE
MSSIGRGNLKCFCGKVRPYWSDYCKQHREEAEVNEALKEAGLNLQVVKGDGYHYFTGPDAESMSEQGLYGWTLGKAKPVEIVDEAKRRIADER